MRGVPSTQWKAAPPGRVSGAGALYNGAPLTGLEAGAGGVVRAGAKGVWSPLIPSTISCSHNPFINNLHTPYPRLHVIPDRFQTPSQYSISPSMHFPTLFHISSKVSISLQIYSTSLQNQPPPLLRTCTQFLNILQILHSSLRNSPTLCSFLKPLKNISKLLFKTPPPHIPNQPTNPFSGPTQPSPTHISNPLQPSSPYPYPMHNLDPNQTPSFYPNSLPPQHPATPDRHLLMERSISID